MLGQGLGKQKAVRQQERACLLLLPPKKGHHESQLRLRSSTYHVPLLIVLIPNDEDHVKSGQDGGHKINVLLALGLIPAPKDGVGSCQNRAAGIECGCDSCLWAKAKKGGVKTTSMSQQVINLVKG